MPFRTSTPAPVDIYVASCSPFDPVSGSTVSVNLTTYKYLNTESGDSPASTSFRPGMQINGFKLSTLDLDTGMIGGFLSGAQGEILIPNTDRELDPWLRYSWVGRVLEVKRVPKGTSYNSASGGTSVIKGYVTGVSADRRWLRISFESFDSVLERKPLSPYKYWGRPRALRFGSASSHYVSCGDLVDITGDCTVEVFLKLNSDDATTKYLVKKQSGTTGYYVNIASTEVLRASFDGGITNAFSTTALTVGQWVFVSVVFDNAGNTVKFYLNGVLDATVAYTAGPPTNTAHTLFLGGDGGTNSANCDIGEIRIWNTARTQQKILENLHGGLQSDVVPSSLIGWWRFEEGTGATLNDTSATNANGTITGATWFGTYEGDEALGGRRKPIGYGGCGTANNLAWTGQPYIEPLLIDAQKLIYAVSARGFEASMGLGIACRAYDGGNEITSGGTSTDLWSTTVSAGQFKYDVARGLIRLNAIPSGKLTVRFQSFDGGTFFGILSSILTDSAGFTSGDYSLDSGDFADFDQGSFAGGSMIYSPDGEMTCADAIRQALHSARAWGGFGELGVFEARPISKSTVANLPVYALTDQQFAGLTLIGVIPPVKSVKVQYRPYLPAHDDSEVNGAVSADTRRDLARQYREQIVSRCTDRFGRDFANYKEDARELILQTVLNQPAQATAFGTALLDLFDTFVPVWELQVLDPDVYFETSLPLQIGREVSITDAAYNLSGKECIVVGMSRTISGANCRVLVQLAEVPTLAS
jgi:hypothetical protein